jgi:hypothetical protein
MQRHGRPCTELAFRLLVILQLDTSILGHSIARPYELTLDHSLVEVVILPQHLRREVRLDEWAVATKLDLANSQLCQSRNSLCPTSVARKVSRLLTVYTRVPLF